MDSKLIPISSSSPEVIKDQEESRRHYEASWASATLKAYRSDWKDWEEYCEARNLIPLPADPISVAGYLSALVTGNWGKPRKMATIERRKSAISHIHIESGLTDPASDPRVPRVLKGIRREKTVQQDRKAALRSEDIKALVQTLGNDPRGIRDRALILIGFATACRRSELVSLRVDDIREHREGIIIEVRKSKTDQEGKGLLKLIRYGQEQQTCPIIALKKWMNRAEIKDGCIFRSITTGLRILDNPMSTMGVSRAIKRAAKAANLNPTMFAAHSMRAGYVTEADARGARTSDIMSQTGHQSTKMIYVYTRYNVDEQFDLSTALDLGL